ncbi:DMT family transporter [Jannaschia sp.]|nr:DMT family transporter [Jannaschia sp.]
MAVGPQPGPSEFDRPGLGLTLMLGFCLLAPASDAFSKTLAEDIPVLELVFARFVIQASVLLPIVYVTSRQFRVSRLGLQLIGLRTALHVAGIYLMVTGLTYLPLADAIAIAFVMPFILLLMGHFLLGEVVGRRRLVACAVGFGGTLMVMQPSFAEVGWPVLYPLAVAFVFAGFILVTRRVAHEVDPVTMQGVSGVMAVLGLGLMYLLLPREGLFALEPIGPSWPLWLMMGLTGTVAHLLMSWSLRYAATSTVAPMQYIEIPVAALIGLVAFGDCPNIMALGGITITMGTGLYILWHESTDREALP